MAEIGKKYSNSLNEPILISNLDNNDWSWFRLKILCSNVFICFKLLKLIEGQTVKTDNCWQLWYSFYPFDFKVLVRPLKHSAWLMCVRKLSTSFSCCPRTVGNDCQHAIKIQLSLQWTRAVGLIGSCDVDWSTLSNDFQLNKLLYTGILLQFRTNYKRRWAFTNKRCKTRGCSSPELLDCIKIRAPPSLSLDFILLLFSLVDYYR